MSHTALPEDPEWFRASLAAALFAVDPAGLGGIALRGLPGPVRDRWLQQCGIYCPQRLRYAGYRCISVIRVCWVAWI